MRPRLGITHNGAQGFIAYDTGRVLRMRLDVDHREFGSVRARLDGDQPMTALGADNELRFPREHPPLAHGTLSAVAGMIAKCD